MVCVASLPQAQGSSTIAERLALTNVRPWLPTYFHLKMYPCGFSFFGAQKGDLAVNLLAKGGREAKEEFPGENQETENI